MKKQLFACLPAGLLMVAWSGNVFASATALVLRSESGTCVYNGTATQTVEAEFGDALAALPFSGTTTYDFYSPPLAAPMSLTTSHKGGGIIFMRNNSTDNSHDFSVAAGMQYFDYDPATGSEVLIVDTTASPHKDVNHGQTVHWPIYNSALPVNVTIPAGHLLHISLLIQLKSGNPGGFGELLYNGLSDRTTVGLLPQNASVNWSFAPPTPLPDAPLISSMCSVWANSTGNIASVPDTAGAAYVWTITNGTITGGQGTSQITWSAGPMGPVTLGVVVAKTCATAGFASVNVVPHTYAGSPETLLCFAAMPDGSTRVSAAGTPGMSYLIQAATNLAAPVWTTLATATADANGLFVFIDRDAKSYPSRFYRVSTP